MSNSGAPTMRARSNSVGRAPVMLGQGVNLYDSGPLSAQYEDMILDGRAQRAKMLGDALKRVGCSGETHFLDEVVRGAQRFDRFRVTFVRVCDDGSDALQSAVRALEQCCDSVHTTQSSNIVCALVSHRRYDTRLVPLDLTCVQLLVVAVLTLIATLLCASAIGNSGDAVWRALATVL